VSGPDETGTHVGAPPEAPEIRPTRLVATLAIAGALAGSLLVLVFQATQPTIRDYKERMLQLAVREVLGEPDRHETLWVDGDALVAEPPAGESASSAERVYLGFDGEGRPVGFAIEAAEPGFQDLVRLIFGYDPTTRTILGMKVLESKETPGLGDKIEKDPTFLQQFAGIETPLVGVKAGGGSVRAAQGGDSGGGEVDMITGATISSRTVIRTINNALERLSPILEARVREAKP